MIQTNWDAPEPSTDLGYGELFKILWRRRFWFLGVFIGVLNINTLISFHKPEIYLSSMQLLVEPNYERTRDSQDRFADGGRVEIDYATQLNLMRSSQLLNQAIISLQNKYPDITLEELKKSLKIYQVIEGERTETKIIQADYKGNSANLTQEVLETIQQVYLEYNLKQQETRLQDGLSFINSQIPEARQDLIKAESSITELRNRYNLINPEQQANAIAERLDDIKKERESLKAEYQQINGRVFNLQQQLNLLGNNNDASGRLTQSQRYQNLLNELQTLELELAAQRTRFTDNNPIIQDLLAERDSKKALLAQESQQILGKVPPQLNLDATSLQQQGQLGESETQVLETLTHLKADLKGMEQKQLTLAQAEQELSKQLNEFPSIIAQYNNLEQEAAVKRNTLQRLLEAKQELGIEIDRGSFNWQIVEPPREGILIAPDLKRDLALGVVVASFLGGFAAFMREASDNRVFDRKQIEQKTALPILGTIPREPFSNNHHLLGQVPFSPPKSLKDILRWQPFRESIDIVYENLRLLNSYKSLTVTSAIANEGKSTLICGLAASAARRHQKVLIIDANLRLPYLHQEFGILNQNGLSDWLARGIKVPTIHPISLSGESIHLIVAGSKTADPVKLLSNPRFTQLIKNLEQKYDLVLVDAPPVIGTVDSIKIASCCDGVILVSRINNVKLSELVEATNLLAKLNLIGVVANDSQESPKEQQPKFLLPQKKNLN